jgi:cytoskeletal protein CcmA (bactofilin family)
MHRPGTRFAGRNPVKGVSMNGSAHIGPTITVKGEVTAAEPLTIAGQVDGSVEVVGHPLTIVEGGKATATLLAPTIVVSGAVRGSLCANEKIVVSQTAEIDGDLAAPALSLADGAKVQGRIDTGERKARPLPVAS